MGHLAERVGFEPTVPLRGRRFSRPVQSTALPPLRAGPGRRCYQIQVPAGPFSLKRRAIRRTLAQQKAAGKGLERGEMETLPESSGIAGNASAHERRRDGSADRVEGATFALLVLFGINLLNFFD